jgi:hypothetical protein
MELHCHWNYWNVCTFKRYPKTRDKRADPRRAPSSRILDVKQRQEQGSRARKRRKSTHPGKSVSSFAPMKRKACPGPAPRSSPRRRPDHPTAHPSAPVAAGTSTGTDEEDASRTGSSTITTMNVAAAHAAAANVHGDDDDDDGDVIEIVPPERGSGGAAEAAAFAPAGGAAVPLLVKDSSVPAPAPICYEVFDDDEDAMEYEYDDEDYQYAFDAAGGREIPGPSAVDDRKMPALTRTAGGAAGKGTVGAAGAAASATATTSAPNFFDLCNDDEDNDEGGGGLRYGDKYFDWNNDGFLSEEMKFGSGPWAGADPMTSPLPPAFDAASQPFGTAFAAFTALPKNGTNVRARRHPAKSAADKSGGTQHDDGVIDLEKDEDESTNKDDEAARARLYRRILGPLRFDFCEELPHHDATSGYRAVPHGPFASAVLSSSSKATKAPAHNAASASAATSRTKTNLSKLAKELVELKLNLPIELSSSIFVRAKEGDMSLIRALITGTLRAWVAGFSMRRNYCLFAP